MLDEELRKTLCLYAVRVCNKYKKSYIQSLFFEIILHLIVVVKVKCQSLEHRTESKYLEERLFLFASCEILSGLGPSVICCPAKVEHPLFCDPAL